MAARWGCTLKAMSARAKVSQFSLCSELPTAQTVCARPIKSAGQRGRCGAQMAAAHHAVLLFDVHHLLLGSRRAFREEGYQQRHVIHILSTPSHGTARESPRQAAAAAKKETSTADR